MAKTLTTTFNLRKDFRRYEKFPNLKPTAISKSYEVRLNPKNVPDSRNSNSRTYVMVRSHPVNNKTDHLHVKEAENISPRKWFGHTKIQHNALTMRNVLNNFTKMDYPSADSVVKKISNNREKNSFVQKTANVESKGHIVMHCQDLNLGDGKEDMANNETLKYEKLKTNFLNKSRIMEREYKGKKDLEVKNHQDAIKNGWNYISYELPERRDLEKEETDQQREINANSNITGMKEPSNDVVSGNACYSGEKEGEAKSHAIVVAALDEETNQEKVEVRKGSDYQILDNLTTQYPYYKTNRGQRNTRFGGDRKITAYRPSTTLDFFRKTKQDSNVDINNPANKIDLEEGSRIWEEVNDMLYKDTVRKTLSSKKRAHSDGDGRTESVRNAIELRALKNVATGILGPVVTKNGIWVDDKWPGTGNFSYNENIQNAINKRENFQKKLNKVEDNALPVTWMKRTGGNFLSDVTEADDKGNMFMVDEAAADKQSDILEMSDPCIRENGIYQDLDDQHSARRSRINIHVVHPVHDKSNQPAIHLPTAGACKVSVTMTTTLPRITPSSTPLPTGITQQPQRSHSSASMYTAYPPKELSSSMDFMRIPGRINPLAPPPPRRRINWSWETTDQHYENEKRSLLMQKREHTRYHSAWSKAYYGAPAEKEAYRRHFREVLKQQMDDKDSMHKDEMVSKVKETERALNYDRDCRMNDAQEYHRKHSYLMQYRDVNKQEMEQAWATRRYNKQSEDRVDRERLRYNPINWSCSLK